VGHHYLELRRQPAKPSSQQSREGDPFRLAPLDLGDEFVWRVTVMKIRLELTHK
jgi:hypothetical protein